MFPHRQLGCDWRGRYEATDFKMSSQSLKRQTKKQSVPLASSSVPNVRSCGCARRFVSTLPQQSASAPVLARRRSRSSTGSSCKSLPRSRTPSNFSSGRSSTPSPVPPLKLGKAMSEGTLLDEPPGSPELQPEPDITIKGPSYTTKCGLKRVTKPIHFSTTVFIRLGTSKQHYLEQVKYEMQYIPEYYQEDTIPEATLKNTRHFKTELEIMLEKPSRHIHRTTVT